MEVKIVVGANYGDEGKGMATAYFSKQANEQGKKCLNVLYNGSCQRGHTVRTRDGRSHIFHHFGSGSFYGADTYLNKDFIVNPIFFLQEIETGIRPWFPKVFVQDECLVAIPFDAILNQFFESERREDKHGSCGFGVFETVVRNRHEDYQITYDGFSRLSYMKQEEKLWDIVLNYIPKRLKDNGYSTIPESVYDILGGKYTGGIIKHFIADFQQMQNFTKIVSGYDLPTDYNMVIYEGGQGLALDMYNIQDFPHLTPSITTPVPPLEEVNKRRFFVEEPPEICYVTRSYITRHGAGPFPTECKKDEINPQISDSTNTPNPFQDSLRYGWFDFKNFEGRVRKSIGDACEVWGGFNLKTSYFLTYADSNPKQKNALRGFLGDMFDTGYYSNTPYIDDVKGVRE